MGYLTQLTPWLCVLLELGCGIVLVLRLRGFLQALLGGTAFVLIALGTIGLNALFGFGWSPHIVGDLLQALFGNPTPGIIRLFLTFMVFGYACLLIALLTGRTHVAAGASALGQPERISSRKVGERGPVSVNHVLFSFEGRISRSEYWLKGILILLPFVILENVMLIPYREYHSVGAPFIASMVLGLAMVWPSLAILVKRWHDRGRSAWWLWTLLIPFLNFLSLVWIVVEAWFLRGTEGPNRFGGDPLPGEKLNTAE